MNQSRPSLHLTLAQARYQAAFGFAEDAKRKLKDFSRYVVLVKKFPAMVNSNGLGQALAYLSAKRKEDNAEGCLLEHLGKWLTKSEHNKNFSCYLPPYSDLDYQPGKLLQAIRQQDSRAYLRATVETLALLNYLRLCADSLEKGETS